jgi:Domain of unknown function (DUF4383)
MSTRVRTSDRSDRADRDWPDYVVLAFGLVYLAVGLLGFTVTDGVGFADNRGDELFGIFQVNPLHNIVHLVIGAALTGAYLAGRRAALSMAAIVGVTYLLVGVVGPFLSGDSNILALNSADHVLHIGTAGVLLLTAMLGRRTLETDSRARAHA